MFMTVVVVALSLCAALSVADERCWEVPLNTSCSGDLSSVFYWSDDLQTCVNKSVCVMIENDDLFLSLDQCLNVCKENDRIEDVHKDCLRTVTTRCESRGRVFRRPQMRYSYDHQIKDCKIISILKCPPEHLNGTNIFTTMTECREFCGVRVTTDTPTTIPTTDTSDKTEPTAQPHQKPGPQEMEHKPHTLFPVVSTAKVEEINSKKDELDVDDIGIPKANNRSNYGTGKFHPIIVTASASIQLTYHSVCLWTMSMLLLATNV